MTDDEHLPHHLRRADLLADGWEPGELRRLLRTGRMVRIGPGAYLPAKQLRRFGGTDAHRVLARAALERLGDDVVLSHASAALVHGLPDWGLRRDVVHVTRPRDGRPRGDEGAGQDGTARAGRGRLVDGLPTTAVARTVVDVLREVPSEVGVVVADAALRTGTLTPADLRTSVASAGRRPGVARARRVVAFADGRKRERRRVAQPGGAGTMRPACAGRADPRPGRRPVRGTHRLLLDRARHRRGVRRDGEVRRRRVDRAFARAQARRTPHSAQLVVTARTS